MLSEGIRIVPQLSCSSLPEKQIGPEPSATITYLDQEPPSFHQLLCSLSRLTRIPRQEEPPIILYARVNRDGSVEIPNVPPGTYRLEATPADRRSADSASPGS